MSTTGRPGFRGGIDSALLVAVLLVAINLRAPITSVPPVVSDVAADLHLTTATAGLLTGIPVLCFAIATPVLAGVLGRSSLRTAVAVALVLIFAGTLLRSTDLSGIGLGYGGTFAGTVLIGLGITTANLAVPMIAQRDFPGHVGTVTGLYTAAINVGTVATTALTAPLAGLVGWRWALASWGVLAVVALVWWWRVVPRDTPARTTSASASAGVDPGAERSVLATPFTWGLCAMFALQSSSFYALTAWLPLILHDLAGIPQSAAGGAASLFQGFAIVGGLAVPLATRRVSMRTTFVGIAVLWLMLPAGLLLAPHAWVIWASAAGVAQAANFVVIFTVVAQRFPTAPRARAASATIQTVGYSFAAVAPTAAGALHAATGTWNAPVAVVLVALAAMAVVGVSLTGRTAPPAHPA